jgi:hypothetical protein
MIEKVLFFICLFTLGRQYGYAYPPMKINDTGVRLRAAPGLTGDIIRILEKDEEIVVLTQRRPSVDDLYYWLNVETRTGRGWVYGEFVSLSEGIVPYKLNSLESVKILIENGVLEIGMERDAVISLLGQPVAVSIDEERNEEWLEFDKNGKITIMITRYNNRVNQVGLTSTHYLANGIHIGMDINTILSINTMSMKRPFLGGYLYGKSLPDFWIAKSEYYTILTMQTDAHGIIIKLQLDGPSEP